MKMIPLPQSTNVRAAGYDTSTSTLTVEFHRGAMYEYYGVPVGLFHELTDGMPSPWTRTNRRIKLHRCHQIR